MARKKQHTTSKQGPKNKRKRKAVPKMHRDTDQKADFFDSHAEKWDSYYFPEEIERIRLLIGKCRLEPGEVILEPGCGTGIITRQIAETVPGARIVSVDSSPGMIRKAMERNLKNVEFVNVPLENADFKERSFTSILFFNCFPHFDEKESILSLCYNLLVDEGRLFIIHSISRKQLNEIHKNAGTTVEKDVLPPSEMLAPMLKAAGFKLTEAVDSDEYFYIESVKK